MKAIRISMVVVAVVAIVYSLMSLTFMEKWQPVKSRKAGPSVVTIDQVEKQFNVTIEMPTIEWVQQRLGCEKIDGKLADGWKTSETQRLWEQQIFNQYAGQYFRKDDNVSSGAN